MKRVILTFCMVLFFSPSWAGDYFQGMKYIDKETCTIWAGNGQSDGIKDRKAGIANSSGPRKRRVAEMAIGKGINIATTAEVMTCYEEGYDIGYYNK